jgi:hypothetical protein
MGYFDYRQIPYYWDYASQFVLLDNYYSSVMGPSMPNHLYLVAGQAGSMTSNARFGQINFTSKNIHNSTFEFKPIVDELDVRHISWKYYAGGYQFLNNWNPLIAFASIKNNYSRQVNLASTEQFATDVKSGHLPSVAWVMPRADYLSEHPPYNVTAGQHETVALINSIMQSSFWNSTAIFLTWDDYGGWYDHVPPPQTTENGVDTFGYGFRVPCIVISPYSERHVVDHTQADHTSLLKFIETTFSLPSLTPRDSSANNLLEAFDFRSPGPPMILPGPFVPDHYPPTPLINGTLVPLRTASQPLPNLSIQKVSLKPPHPKVGEMVRVNFTVENIGDAAADGVTVSLYLNDTSHKYELIESSQPLNLKSGESQSHSFSSTIKAAMGFQAVIVVADDISSVKEVQKDNNALIRLFQVSPGDLAAIPEKTTTVSSTVTVATTLTVTQTASVTSTSFQTRMSTVTETTTTVSAHPNQYVYGSALLVVATILLATFAVTKAGRAAKNTNG